MKKFFGIFIILSTFAVPAFSEQRKISPALAEARLEKYCDSQGYRVYDDQYKKYVASLGEVTTDCKSSPAIVTIGCYTYKKMDDNTKKKIHTEFAKTCSSNKTNTVKILSDLQRPTNHLSQAELCKETDGEWKDNKCTCNPKDGIYYKYDKTSGCSIKDEYRTKQESKKAEQKAKTEQQKADCESFALNKWTGTKCVCKNNDPDYKMQNGRCTLTKKALDKQAKAEEKEELEYTKEKCLYYELNHWDEKNQKCVCKNNDPDYEMQNDRCMLTTAARKRMENADEEPDTSVELSTSAKEKLCRDSGGEWKPNKCKCKNGYKLTDNKCVATDKQKQKEEKAAAKKQLASDCATAGGEIKAGKCKCNDNKKIYDPDTIKCISKTANYNAAVDILKQINSALDETMTKLSKKTQEEK